MLQVLAKMLRAREPAIHRQVDELRAAHPDAGPEEIARIMIARTRRRLAGSAAATGAAAIIPGVGTLFSLGTAAGQSLYALEQEVELVLGVSIAYGYELEENDRRLLEALLVVGLAGGAVKLRDAVLVAGGQRVTVAAFRRLPEMFMARAGGHVLGRVMAHVLSSNAASVVARAAPLAVGMAAGAAFDWIAVTGLGRAAIRYYGRLPAAPARPGVGPGAGDDSETVELEP